MTPSAPAYQARAGTLGARRTRAAPLRARYLAVPALAGVGVLHAEYDAHVFAPHAHDDAYVLAAVSEGEAAVTVGGAPCTLTRAHVLVVSPGVVYGAMGRGAGRWHYHALHASSAALALLASSAGLSDPTASLRSGVRHAPELAALLRGTLGLLAAHGADAAAQREPLLDLLRRLAEPYAPPPRAAPPAPVIPEGVESARRAIATAPERDWSGDDLARHAALSTYHFIRLFKAAFGVTPHAYVVQTRVDRALRALLDGEPARRAATRAGFVDESHMARHLKRILGVTPGQVEARREVPRAPSARQAGGSYA